MAKSVDARTLVSIVATLVVASAPGAPVS
jgi:hypothetical protein